jgi:hypothetical protein
MQAQELSITFDGCLARGHANSPNLGRSMCPTACSGHAERNPLRLSRPLPQMGNHSPYALAQV